MIPAQVCGSVTPFPSVSPPAESSPTLVNDTGRSAVPVATSVPPPETRIPPCPRPLMTEPGPREITPPASTRTPPQSPPALLSTYGRSDLQDSDRLTVAQAFTATWPAPSVTLVRCTWEDAPSPSTEISSRTAENRSASRSALAGAKTPTPVSQPVNVVPETLGNSGAQLLSPDPRARAVPACGPTKAPPVRVKLRAQPTVTLPLTIFRALPEKSLPAEPGVWSMLSGASRSSAPTRVIVAGLVVVLVLRIPAQGPAAVAEPSLFASPPAVSSLMSAKTTGAAAAPEVTSVPPGCTRIPPCITPKLSLQALDPLTTTPAGISSFPPAAISVPSKGIT